MNKLNWKIIIQHVQIFFYPIKSFLAYTFPAAIIQGILYPAF